MSTFLKVLRVLAILTGIFFIVTFIVYFENLDMKLAAKVMPKLNEHYDKRPRSRKL